MKKKIRKIVILVLGLMLVFGITNTALAMNYDTILSTSANSPTISWGSDIYSDINIYAWTTISGVDVASYYYTRLYPDGTEKLNYHGQTKSWQGDYSGSHYLRFRHYSQYTVSTHIHGVFVDY